MSDHDETRHIPTVDELTEARRSVESMLDGVHLGDEALWVQPSRELEHTIMDTVEAELPQVASVSLLSDQPADGRSWWIPAAVAAVAIVLLAVLALRPASPDWEVSLGATAEAPGVTAAVLGWNEASGTRLELDIAGLDRAPTGFVYELWFSEGPIHISAGTFQEPRDVTLWVGVSRADYPRLWITLEPIDEDPGPGINLLDTEA
ncbi:MAG: anti-sigma factor [Acidimicrobiia bacterium]|nr:anti-sigma factor [Acidimicrobiia bacterium]